MRDDENQVCHVHRLRVWITHIVKDAQKPFFHTSVSKADHESFEMDYIYCEGCWKASRPRICH